VLRAKLTVVVVVVVVWLFSPPRLRAYMASTSATTIWQRLGTRSAVWGSSRLRAKLTDRGVLLDSSPAVCELEGMASEQQDIA